MKPGPRRGLAEGGQAVGHGWGTGGAPGASELEATEAPKGVAAPWGLELRHPQGESPGDAPSSCRAPRCHRPLFCPLEMRKLRPGGKGDIKRGAWGDEGREPGKGCVPSTVNTQDR